jgi:threonine/homoserine/homoserine lactone efflux protein
MQSVPAFLAVAAAMTLIPGPAFALLLQVAAVHGRRAALANIAGNSVGVLTWGLLSAAGVSALVAANRVAYEVLHLAGAAFLLWLGLRALLSRRTDPHLVAAPDRSSSPRPALTAARKGLVNSLANPKPAVFFVSLFPQFIEPATAVLPAALAMAAVIVLFDVLWYGTVAMLVDRVRDALAERLLRRLERLTGAVLVFFGIRLATEAR